MTPREFTAHLKKGDFAPVYALFGDEPYLVERESRRFIECAVDQGFREFNLNTFYATESTGEEICEAALSLPMFAERRVVWVKRTDALSPRAQEILADYLQSPSPSTCLLLQAGKLDQRKKMFVELKKVGILVECKKLYENQIPDFISAEVTERGKKISPEAVELLCFLIGTNLQDLAGQIEKAVLYAGDRQIIAVDDIRAIVSDTKVDSIFDFTDALGMRNAGQALRFLHTVLRENNAPLYLLNMLVRHFRQLWLVRAALDKRILQPDAIAETTGIKVFVVRKMLPHAKNFTPSNLRELFRLFVETDQNLKGGSSMPLLVLERLILRICGST